MEWWQYVLYGVALISGWLMAYYFHPWISHKLALKRELAVTYLVPFKKWCSVLYKEITEFKERYTRDDYEGTYNQLSRTLIIIDYRELHDVLREAGRYLGKIEKEKPEVAKYLNNLADLVDNLWHGLQDDFPTNFDLLGHDEWIKAIIQYPEKEEFVKGITEKRKDLNQALLKYFQKEKDFNEVRKYLLKQVPEG